MKLVIQIPCLNEEKTIGTTIRSVPQKLTHIDQIEIIIINDGSSDLTAEEAKKAGAHHIVQIHKTCGLANAFMRGIDESLKRKADIIVNLDADNQYDPRDIPKIIEPIINGKAEIVIGDRQIEKLNHFTPLKRTFEQLGSKLIGWITGLAIPDAVSGFRAFSQEAALRINLRTRFSHTLETIVFAAKERIPILSVPVEARPTERASRLALNSWSFIKKSAASLIRVYLIYEPFKVFLSLGAILFCLGLIPIVRFLFFFFSNHGAGHIQSLLIGAVLIILAFIFATIGLIADLLALNRSLIEKQLLEFKRIRYNL
jgi:glycosyltransferase involved in cell wall biosynthesis